MPIVQSVAAMYIIHYFAPQTNPCNTIDVLKAQQSFRIVEMSSIVLAIKCDLRIDINHEGNINFLHYADRVVFIALPFVSNAPFAEGGRTRS